MVGATVMRKIYSLFRHKNATDERGRERENGREKKKEKSKKQIQQFTVSIYERVCDAKFVSFRFANLMCSMVGAVRVVVAVIVAFFINFLFREHNNKKYHC